MLNLVIGPMYSGKTSELLNRFERHNISGKKILIIKYNEDNRYSKTDIVTHNNRTISAQITNELKLLDNIIENYDVILIDEIQFYNDSHIFADKWSNNKIVECFGLNGDFKREPFEQISLLIPKCDNILHLKAVDKNNGKDAPFTFRKINSEKKKLIGGNEMYEALSRENYLYYQNNK